LNSTAPVPEPTTILLSGLGLLGIAVGIILTTLNDTIVFFYSPSEVAQKHITGNTRFRVGGLVEKGTLKRGDGETVTFSVTDNEKSMPIAKFKDLPLNVSPQNKASLLNNKEILGYNPFKKSGKLPTIAQQKTLLHGYYACASWVDSLVGQLLDELARTDDPVQKGKKMSETTIVVFWGDHGFHLGDHGRWAKHSNMERATSCPLIVYDPRTPGKGAKTTSPVSTLDIYPTLCALAGLPVPDQPKSRQAKHGRPLRGVNFAPLLKNPNASVRKGALTVFSIKGCFGYAYRTKQYRYIEWVNKKNKVVARDLYDYKKDPLETKNLINDRAYADVVTTLARALRADPSSQGCTRLQASSLLKK